VDYRESNDFGESKLMFNGDYTIRAVDPELWRADACSLLICRNRANLRPSDSGLDDHFARFLESERYHLDGVLLLALVKRLRTFLQGMALSNTAPLISAPRAFSAVAHKSCRCVMIITSGDFGF